MENFTKAIVAEKEKKLVENNSAVVLLVLPNLKDRIPTFKHDLVELFLL